MSGALRWLGGQPLIQLNDHFQAKDSFIFSLFHEFAHMLLHDKRAEYVDFDKREEGKFEKEADDWACGTLISPANYKDFLDSKDFSLSAIIRLAKRLEINKDIVA